MTPPSRSVLYTPLARRVHPRSLMRTLSVVLTATLLTAASDPGRWSVSEEERFLLTARIVGEASAGKGITDSKKATLTNGRRTHLAHIQWIDIHTPLFK